MMRWRFIPLTLLGIALTAGAAGVRSGYEYLLPETWALQDDDFGNPGLAMVDEGRALFQRAGANGKACADCHGTGGERLDVHGIARYPVFDQERKRPITLRERIRLCRSEKQAGPALSYAGRKALALETFVRHLARGQPVAVEIGGPMAAHYEAGRKLFHTRWGQVDIACHQCHDNHAGQHFRGQTLTQGQTNGLPAYRLATGEVAGAHERFRQCMHKLRAEPFAIGSPEFIDLEVYANARGNGLPIETPGVRY